MKRYIIFFIFVICCLGLVVWAVRQYQPLSPGKINATGFGVSPPEAKFTDLIPGQVKEEKIMILRSNADQALQVEARLEADEIQNWVSISPARGIYFAAGNFQTPIQVTVSVPEDAVSGEYRGDLYLFLSSPGQKAGANINVGARVKLAVGVVNGQEPPISSEFQIKNQSLYARYQGLVIVKPGDNKQMFYVHPKKAILYYFDGSPAVQKMLQEQSLGIANEDLEKIPVSLDYLSGPDSDRDGLPNEFEAAYGTEALRQDTDSDGWSDRDEIANNYSPLGKESLKIDLVLSRKLSGLFLLQVENRGQAWYLNPGDKKRHFLGKADQAFQTLGNLASMINDQDFSSLINE